MNSDDKIDYSIPVGEALIYSFVLAIPLAILLSVFYVIFWGFGQLMNGFNMLFSNLLVFLVIFIIGVILHELIHGVAWAFFGKKPLRAIKFGIQITTLTPYAHCKEPMNLGAYRIGTLMPGFTLGILPAMVGIISGNGWIMAFGILFTIAAGGDFLVLWLIRGVDASRMVEDHPTRAGCYVSGGES